MTDRSGASGNIWRRIRLILLAAALCAVSVISGVFWRELHDFLPEEPYADHIAKAAYAFKETGLFPSFDVDYVLEGSHLGRDSFRLTVFEIPYEAYKSELMILITDAEGWHVEAIGAGDYRDFAEVTWFPSMLQATVADDIVFDAWYYRKTTPSAGYEPMQKGCFRFLGRAARGFEFAVYDRETGLFIFIDQFG